MTFEFQQEFYNKRPNNESFLRIFFQVETEALAFLDHARKIYNHQKKDISKKMFIIRKLTSQADYEDQKIKKEDALLKSTFSTKLAKMTRKS